MSTTCFICKKPIAPADLVQLTAVMPAPGRGVNRPVKTDMHRECNRLRLEEFEASQRAAEARADEDMRAMLKSIRNANA